MFIYNLHPFHTLPRDEVVTGNFGATLLICPWLELFSSFPRPDEGSAAVISRSF